jgi:hypothetical protein
VIIFLSGEGRAASPERILGNDAYIMLTFFESQNKPCARYRRVHEARSKDDHLLKRVRDKFARSTRAGATD